MGENTVARVGPLVRNVERELRGARLPYVPYSLQLTAM